MSLSTFLLGKCANTKGVVVARRGLTMGQALVLMAASAIFLGVVLPAVYTARLAGVRTEEKWNSRKHQDGKRAPVDRHHLTTLAEWVAPETGSRRWRHAK
jgi:hypothetical protein